MRTGVYRLDVTLLFTARAVRMFAYGFLSIILALYLVRIGLSDEKVGVLFSLTLAGDAVVSFLLTTHADRLGRRRTLIAGSLLMGLSGLVFAVTGHFLLLLTAAIVGVISPSGKEIGPFLSIEQASLAGLIQDKSRTKLFGWYHLTGSFSAATGSLVGGWMPQYLQSTGMTDLQSYQIVVAGYAMCGGLLTLLFLFLTHRIEPHKAAEVKTRFGLHRSKAVVFKLSSLFALDAFGGGFIVQSIMAWWLFEKFGVAEGMLGSLFFGTEILAGLSALLAAKIASKIGLVRTMVFTHIPSNIMLALVPLMPSAIPAMTLILLRASISQMDVPTRQSYTLAVVDPDERSAASGVTTIARSVGSAASPALSGICMAQPALIGVPFLAAAAVKLLYDVSLFRAFRNIKPPEETPV